MSDLTLYMVLTLSLIAAMLAFKAGYMNKRECKWLVSYALGSLIANPLIEGFVPPGFPQAFAYAFLLGVAFVIGCTVAGQEHVRS